MYKDKNVLELGAGGALPSLVTAKNGAGAVVITDYPDKSLIENIDYNVQSNLTSEEQKHVSSKGYIWGQPTSGLLDCEQPKFDLVILSDLIFNHSQHDALLSTCESVIRSDASQVLVFYSHHRPHLAHRDMLFFEKAKERQWEVEKVVEEKFPPMFPEDPGDEDVRATVHGWRLTRTGGMKTT
ncbi:hypothetical protein CC2G_008164 [Coprinopsis cinerea AmutBmut pab1-1]|nr:hypothetical protein CC2G_008164 [Coprinopsis cinerea AmutBmut pab1-1]